MRAPELRAGSWLNVDHPLRLADLRGRFVLLDFWTSSCANCLHVLDELRPLERRLADVLTVIGVHSPKFAYEAQDSALRAAVERNGITHPVLSDPDLTLWRQYTARAWPTLVLIDPEGYVVAQVAGERQTDALGALIDARLEEYRARGTLHSGPVTAPQAAAPPKGLRYPAKAITLPAERTGRAEASLLVADAGHHQIVELTGDGATVLRRIGSGTRGTPFAEPNGLALLPAGLAPYDVLVADSGNHVLRGLRLADGTVVATVDLPALLAGARTITGAVPAVLSPWDVAWWPALGRVVVAAAGVHLLLAFDPAGGTAGVLAGTTVEGLRDGPALDGWLAQPSGLAVDGARIWFVDAETSALRYLTLDGTLHTAVGDGLFDFGLVDGPAADARLQHPLALLRAGDGSLAVADTYNGAIRRYDPSTDTVSTLAGGLAEPSGLVDVAGRLLAVESAAHRLTAVPPAMSGDSRPEWRATTRHSTDNPPLNTEGAATELRPDGVELAIGFTPAPGRVLDDSGGTPVRVSVTAAPPELLRTGAGDGHELTRRLEFDGGIAAGTLSVTAQVASCDDGAAEHAACYLSRRVWELPVRVGPGGAGELRLDLTDS